MEKWKNKKAYLNYLHDMYHENKDKTFKVDLENDTSDIIKDKLFILKNASSYYHNKIEDIFTDELYAYMQSYHLNFTIMDIFIIEVSNLLIKKSKKDKTASTGQEYKREMTQLKKITDIVDHHSLYEIIILLPMMESAVKKLLNNYVTMSKMDKETITHVFTYLNVRKARNTNLAKLLMNIVNVCNKQLSSKFNIIDVDEFQKVILAKTDGILYYRAKGKRS